ncbi:MAG: hypothetical protein KDA85_03210 [Planctomycetaceae bacterium]|nr:hypothetical protein [Planctomycetaceae bacterium]
MLVRMLTVMVALGCLGGSAANGQNADLRWKLENGEKLNYDVHQDMTTILDIKGEKKESASKNKLSMTWQVAGLSSAGDAYIVQQSIDRVSMEMEGGPAGKVSFDTAGADAPKSPAARLMLSVFRRIVGQKFVVTMAPSGAIRDVQVPKGLMDAIVESQGSAAGQAPVITEEMLKQMMEQAAVTLPGRDTEPGTSWRTSQVVDMPLGRMTVSSVLKLQKVDTATGNATISVNPTISISPREGAPLTLELIGSRGEGLLIFNTNNGRITKSQLNLTIDMDVKQFGEVVRQTTHQTTVMTLQPQQ